MKTLLGWICDPYVDVILIVLVLFRVGASFNRESSVVEPASPAVYCERCGDYHEDWQAGEHVICSVSKLIKGR